MPADVDLAVAAAKKAFNSKWSHSSNFYQRRQVLLNCADNLEKHLEAIATINSFENGKPMWEATRETKLAVNHVRSLAGRADKIKQEKFSHESAVGFTKRHPIGVCAGICPWNFPVVMPIWKIIGVLATGCTTVLKPSELTPLCALKLAEILVESGMPEGVVNIVPGFGHDAGEALINHVDVAKISFTGSTKVGKHIHSVASATLKRVTLELGGKTPLIISNKADIDKAV